MSQFTIREAMASDRDAILAVLRERWGGETMVIRGEVLRPADHPAFIAVDCGRLVGVATYAPHADTYEVLSLDSLSPGRGIGAALLQEVERAARVAGCALVTLVTTNDNLDALRFYQRRGYRITSIDPGAVDRTRRLKPTISRFGNHDIPIRDEITLTKELAGLTAATNGEVI
jgi:GNAT superfamily N-acetyltransferase